MNGSFSTVNKRCDPSLLQHTLWSLVKEKNHEINAKLNNPVQERINAFNKNFFFEWKELGKIKWNKKHIQYNVHSNLPISRNPMFLFPKSCNDAKSINICFLFNLSLKASWLRIVLMIILPWKFVLRETVAMELLKFFLV